MNKTSRIIICLLFASVFPLPVKAQTKGIIIDAQTMKPIPYVNIHATNNKQVSGTTSDIDGVFNATFAFRSLIFSHINYEKAEVGFENISDTVYLFPKEMMLDEVVISNYKPEWIQRVLRNVVSKRNENYRLKEQHLLYEYETHSLTDSTGYSFLSNGIMQVPEYSEKDYYLLPEKNIIKYKDRDAGTDFENLKRMVYFNFIHDFDTGFLKKYDFKANSSFEDENENIVQLFFYSKKYTDDYGYILVDTLQNVILEFENTAGTEYNTHNQTSALLRSYASARAGWKYEDWHTYIKGKYVYIDGSYQLASCSYRFLMKHSYKTDKDIVLTNFQASEAQLKLMPQDDNNNETVSTWIKLPEPRYMVVFYTKKMRREDEALQKVPILYEVF